MDVGIERRLRLVERCRAVDSSGLFGVIETNRQFSLSDLRRVESDRADPRIVRQDEITQGQGPINVGCLRRKSLPAWSAYQLQSTGRNFAGLARVQSKLDVLCDKVVRPIADDNGGIGHMW